MVGVVGRTYRACPCRAGSHSRRPSPFRLLAWPLPVQVERGEPGAGEGPVLLVAPAIHAHDEDLDRGVGHLRADIVPRPRSDGGPAPARPSANGRTTRSDRRGRATEASRPKSTPGNLTDMLWGQGPIMMRLAPGARLCSFDERGEGLQIALDVIVVPAADGKDGHANAIQLLAHAQTLPEAGRRRDDSSAVWYSGTRSGRWRPCPRCAAAGD